MKVTKDADGNITAEAEVDGRRVVGVLSGPPPCGACGSSEHGHITIDPFSVACPLGVDVRPLQEAAKRADLGIRVRLPVASTRVDRKRECFSAAALDDIVVQLNARPIPVLWFFDMQRCVGATIEGTARVLLGGLACVDATIRAVWGGHAAFAKLLDAGQLGAGLAGSIVEYSNVDTIRVHERVVIHSMSLMELTRATIDEPVSRVDVAG